MTLKITNTFSRAKENFIPVDPSHVKMYVCGPTVYDYAHIGNARPVVVFDVLYRLLKTIYPRVTYVRNINYHDNIVMDSHTKIHYTSNTNHKQVVQNYIVLIDNSRRLAIHILAAP